jgi:cytochrome b
VYWGFVGSPTARFTQFVRAPREVARYFKEPRAHSVPGHNPLGGYSVVAMLALLLAQVTIGLFVTDIDGLESGPLSYLVSFEASRALAEAHEIIFNILLGLIAMHIAAILFYLFARRTNLIGAMITGKRSDLSPSATVTPTSLWRVWPGVALALLVVWFVAKDG